MAARRQASTRTNVEAAASGDRRVALEVLRDTLARTLDECEPNMRPQVAGQYRAVLTDLAVLGESKKVVPLHEKLRTRREEARRSTASA